MQANANGHQSFLISHTTVTSNKSQRHSNWHHNVELCSLYHQTKFEGNWSSNVWIQANVVGLFLQNHISNHFFTKSHNHTIHIGCLKHWMDKIQWVWAWSQVWASLHQQVSTVSLEYWMDKKKGVRNSLKTNVSKVYQISSKSIKNFVRQLAQQFLLSHTFVTFNQGEGRIDYYQNVEFISIYGHTKFEPNQFINIQMYGNAKGFWCSQYSSSYFPCFNKSHRLAGLVVRRTPWERKIPGSNPACAGIFSGLSHTSVSKIGTPVATLPGAWRYRVSTGTGQPGVNYSDWVR